jgi:polysaccharide biosynthesis transport protein
MLMSDATNPAGSSIRNLPAEVPDDEIDLGALFGTLWRGKWWIFLSTVIAILIGGYYAFVVAVPVYTADTVVVLESRQEQIVSLDSVMSGLSGDQATINTEVEVIRSRGLISKLVKGLDLTADPEFNATLRPEPRVSLGKLIALVRGAEDRPEPTEQQILDAAIDNVLKALSVSNVRQSYVFRIAAVTESAEKSAAITNRLAELYVREQLEIKFAATEEATSWLTGRVSELQIALENAESEVKVFSADTDLISPEALAGLNLQIKDLRERQADAQAAAEAAGAQVLRMRAARDQGDYSAMELIAADRTLTRISAQVESGSEGAEQTFLNRYELLSLRRSQARSRSENQQATLRSSIETLETRIAAQSSDLVALQQLQREAEASRLIYEYFLGRLKETSVQQGIQQADSRVLSRAVVPRGATAPRKSMILALSATLGVFFAAGLILLREMRQNTIRTADELEKLSGLTVMGQIPNIPARRRRNVLKYLVEKPNSAAAEAVRNLRTSVLLSNVDKTPQIIMSTSSLPDEGKTTQSLALAQNFSGLGKKVLLIEGDIRRRVFGEYFHIGDKPGLLAVLGGDVTLADAVEHNDDLGADILIADKTKINAVDVFSSQKFKTLMDELRGTYDVIIIDTPPVLVVPDARVIGQSVDAILYTVKWDSTTRNQVREGLRMFETVNLKVSGLVLGQIDAKGMKRYGYGGEYGAYGAYGAKYYHN